jgi:hypothetical protein
MGRPKKGAPRIIPKCHPDKLHFAKGLCNTCYRRQYTANRRIFDLRFDRYRGWEYHLNRAYKMTPKQFYDILTAQGGHCKLCDMMPKKEYKAFCVDHDHETGRVRGILCKFCNSKLGWYENRKEKIEAHLKGEKLEASDRL